MIYKMLLQWNFINSVKTQNVYGFYKLIMSITYNKKYKGQILRQNQNKNIQQEVEKQFNTPTKNAANTRSISSSQIPLAKQQGYRDKAKQSQLKQAKIQKPYGRIEQRDQESQYEQNRIKNNKINTVNKGNITLEKNKFVPNARTTNKKHQAEMEEASQDESKSDMTTQSNDRKKISYPSKKKNNKMQLMSKNNTRTINKQPNHKQQQKTGNKKRNKYVFYNNKMGEQQVNEQLSCDNQFISEINEIPKLSNYYYKKHVHIKGQDKKQRLRNKLDFIVDLANKDQVASVSYYSSNGSQQQHPTKKQNIVTQPNYQTKKKTINDQIYNKPQQFKSQKKLKQKKQNFQQQKQPSINSISIKAQVGKKDNKIRYQQPERYNNIKLQRSQDNKWFYNKNKQIKSKPNTFQIKLQEVNIQKPIRIYQTPKKLEERNISSIQTIKKEPIPNYSSKFTKVNPEVRQKALQNNKKMEIDEQLLALLKKNDQYLQNYKIQKHPKNYFQSPRKGANLNNFQQNRRRIKTELDHRNEDLKPLSEQQKATLTKLKARQEELMKKIRYQFYQNPSIIYANESSLQEDTYENQKDQYQYTNQAKQHPSSNTYQISRVLPLLTETFRPKRSEILQNYPQSLKSYQKPNYFNNQFNQYSQNSQVQPQRKNEYQSQEIKDNKKNQMKQQSYSKNVFLFSSRNDKQYKIRNPQQKYQKIKRLLQRV